MCLDWWRMKRHWAPACGRRGDDVSLQPYFLCALCVLRSSVLTDFPLFSPFSYLRRKCFD
jgi:hypothetical protein